MLTILQPGATKGEFHHLKNYQERLDAGLG